MSSWAEVRAEAPEFAERVEQRFATGTNKTIATLRADGSPRISGSELQFVDGEVKLGMMGRSRKLADVRRDPRVAVHSPTVEPPEGTLPGDAKLAGRLVAEPTPQDEPDQDAGYFRIDVTEVALTYLGEPADHLVVESWHAGRGWSRRVRR